MLKPLERVFHCTTVIQHYNLWWWHKVIQTYWANPPQREVAHWLFLTVVAYWLYLTVFALIYYHCHMHCQWFKLMVFDTKLQWATLHLHCIGNQSTIIHHAFLSGVGTSNTHCYLLWGSTATKWLDCSLWCNLFIHHLYDWSLIRIEYSYSGQELNILWLRLLARISSTSYLVFSRTVVTFTAFTMCWDLRIPCKLHFISMVCSWMELDKRLSPFLWFSMYYYHCSSLCAINSGYFWFLSETTIFWWTMDIYNIAHMHTCIPATLMPTKSKQLFTIFIYTVLATQLLWFSFS